MVTVQKPIFAWKQLAAVGLAEGFWRAGVCSRRFVVNARRGIAFVFCETVCRKKFFVRRRAFHLIFRIARHQIWCRKNASESLSCDRVACQRSIVQILLDFESFSIASVGIDDDVSENRHERDATLAGSFLQRK